MDTEQTRGEAAPEAGAADTVDTTKPADESGAAPAAETKEPQAEPEPQPEAEPAPEPAKRPEPDQNVVKLIRDCRQLVSDEFDNLQSAAEKAIAIAAGDANTVLTDAEKAVAGKIAQYVHDPGAADAVSGFLQTAIQKAESVAISSSEPKKIVSALLVALASLRSKAEQLL